MTSAAEAQFDVRERLAAATHYIIARTDPSKLGAVKLNKVLWYADIEAYRRHGKTITGLTTYVRRPQGPVPQEMRRVIGELKDSGKVSERSMQVIDHVRREFVWLKEPDVSVFSAYEVDLLNVFIHIVQDYSAHEISMSTHDALWDELKDGERMSIAAASVTSRKPRAKDLAWAESQ